MVLKLEPDWVVRLAGGDDIERIVCFNERVFRPTVGHWARTILSGTHPTVSSGDFVLVENAESGKIAASLAFIAQRWLFENIPINVAQVEFVGTAEEYRGQGLMRMAMRWFEQRAKEKNCALACVQGVPTLYQKLGYHFAIDLKGGVQLWLDQIPEGDGKGDLQMRAACVDDTTRLVALHDTNFQYLAIRSEMNEALWLYQEQQPADSEHAYETYVFQTGGVASGYLRIRRHSRQHGLVIRELAVGCFEDLLDSLRLAAGLARARGLPCLILQMPISHPVLQIAQSWGAQIIPPYAWQVRVLDWTSFFNLLVPVLEQRLAGTLFDHLNADLWIAVSDENYALRLRFADGRFVMLEQVGEPKAWQLKTTRSHLTALVMGYRSRAVLEAQHLEMQSQPASRYLLDILFPQRLAYIYETY